VQVSGRSRRAFVALCGAPVVATVVAVATAAGTGQRRVSPGVLPIVRSARVTGTFMDCSQVGFAGYIPNRPCDTYFLLASAHFHTATALLTAETRRLGRAGWRYAPATTWGQTLGSDGWIGPHHDGCAVVRTARAGSAAQASLESSMSMPSGFVAFGRAARQAILPPALWVILQPGYDQYDQPRC
jgi:hypothetical protein